MYTNSTNWKARVSAAVACATLALAGPAFAGQDKAKVKPGKPEGGTIVDVAVAANKADGSFTNLLAVVACFDGPDGNPIVDLLNGSDRYTLFAPTDGAFDALLASFPNVTDPCELGLATLGAVLTYHVTEGRRFSNSVFNVNNPKIVEMLDGQFVTTQVTADGDAVLNDSTDDVATVVAANIKASNGVIHVIDKVLIP